MTLSKLRAALGRTDVPLPLDDEVTISRIQRSTHWASFSEQGAFTKKHIHTGGVWTSILPTDGMKYWAAMDPNLCKDGVKDVYRFDSLIGFNNTSVERQSWHDSRLTWFPLPAQAGCAMYVTLPTTRFSLKRH